MVRPRAYVEVKCMTIIAQKMREACKCAIVRLYVHRDVHVSFKARVSEVKGIYCKPYSNH